MQPAPPTPAAGFKSGRFHALWALAVLALNGIAALIFVAIHQYLLAWSKSRPLTASSFERGVEAALQQWVAGWLGVIDPQWAGWTLAIGGPLACFVLAGLRIRRTETLGGAGLSLALGARELRADSSNTIERAVLDPVAAGAAGRRIAVPAVFMLDELDAVCAATLGSRPQDAVLLLSSGAAQRLDRATLEALVAWLLSALDAERVTRDARIAGQLYPLTLPWLLGDRVRDFEAWVNEQYEAFHSQDSPQWKLANFPVPLFFGLVVSVKAAATVVRLLLRVAGFPGLAMARRIVRNCLHGEMLARDQEVAARLPERDALCAALLQAAAGSAGMREVGDELFAADADAVELAHAFFAEPLPVPDEPRLQWLSHRLSSHPEPGERIARISPGFEPAAYEKRQAAHAATQALPAFAHGTPSDPLLKAPAHAPAVTSARGGASEIGDPAEDALRAEFFLRFSRGLLDQLADAQRASRLLLALIAPAAPGNEALRPELEPLGTRERRWLMERCLAVIAPAADALRAAHLREHRALIEADRRVTLAELLDWLFVRRALQPPAAVTGTDRTQDIAMLVAVIAKASSPDEAASASAYATGMAAAGKPALAPAPDRAALSVARVEQALSSLACAGTGERTLAAKACLAAVRADGRFSEQEREMLRRICVILDVPVEILAPPRAAHAGPVPKQGSPEAAREDAVAVAAVDAGDLARSRPCTRCGGRMELLRHREPVIHTLADWFLPALVSIVSGAFILYIVWDTGHGLAAVLAGVFFWLLISITAASLLLTDAHGRSAMPEIFNSRRFRIAVLVITLIPGEIAVLATGAGLGAFLGGMLLFGSLLTYELTRKVVPRNTFYRCANCGIRDSVAGAP